MRDSKILRIILYMILIISICFYIKIYYFDEVNDKKIDLPNNVKGITWYEYDSLKTLEFDLGKVNTNEEILSECKTYNYENNTIKMDCNYKIKIKSIDKYKMDIIISDKTKSYTKTFYSKKEIIEYMINNDMKTITEAEIRELLGEDNTINEEEYKNESLNRLTSLNQLSVDEYVNKVYDENSFILIINPNMNIDSYDIIPLYVNWSLNYNKYKFYYINGNDLSISDQEILNHLEDENLKDLLTGVSDLSILSTGENYTILNVSIIDKINHDKVFDCTREECNKINIKINENDKTYSSMEEYINNKEGI